MTIRQEAYGLIDSLPEDSVHAIVEIMIRMIPVKRQQSESIQNTTAVHARDVSAKMKGFMKMQELRKEMAQYDISDNFGGKSKTPAVTPSEFLFKEFE